MPLLAPSPGTKNQALSVKNGLPRRGTIVAL